MAGLEATFGLPGLVAAPIYCAWAFRELQADGVISLEAPQRLSLRDRADRHIRRCSTGHTLASFHQGGMAPRGAGA